MLEFFAGVIEAIPRMLWRVISVPWDMGEDIAAQLMATPMVNDGPLQTAMPYLETANAWAPVAETAVAITGLWAFQLGFSVLKLVFKAIPTVG